MRRAHRYRRILQAAVLCVFAASSARGQTSPVDDVLGRAMQDELARSMEKLQLAQLERPYFIAYRVQDVRALSVSASLGSLLGSKESRARILTVELRVGNYAFDNTNFFSMPGFSRGSVHPWFGPGELPLDDSYLEIRRQIWLATDAAYKQAIEALAGKRAALENKTRTENLLDFSKEDVAHTADEEPPVQLKRPEAEALVRDLSEVLGELPDLYQSMVSLGVSNTQIRYLNSEGTSYTRSRPLIELTASTSTQALDGMRLGDTAQFYGRSIGSFPTRDQLAAQIRDMGAKLQSLRQAPLFDRYNGPVLFEGRAAAELFSDEFAPALVAQRKLVTGDSQMDAIFERVFQRRASFADKRGARVLPDFLSVLDNPSISEYGNQQLFGGYKADDDGVPARETRLIEDGVLKTFLTARTPVDGVPHSTGNNRGGATIPSNLIVQTSHGLSQTELKDRFIELVKKRGLEYGIVVREIGSGSGATMEEQAMAMLSAMTGGGSKSKSVLLAYKVYPGGREELVRGAHLSGVSAESFKEIVAVSKSSNVYSIRPPRTFV